MHIIHYIYTLFINYINTDYTDYTLYIQIIHYIFTIYNMSCITSVVVAPGHLRGFGVPGRCDDPQRLGGAHRLQAGSSMPGGGATWGDGEMVVL